MLSFSRAGWECKVAVSSEEPRALQQKWPDGVDLLVVDDYDVDSVFESACRPWAKKIMAIEDLTNRVHNVDILVNQNINSRTTDYQNLVPADCKVLVGPGFALLSDAFINKRKMKVPRGIRTRHPARILVSFGGGDNDQLSKIMRAISTLKDDTEVTVVVTSKTRVKEVKDFGFQARCNVSMEEMADLVADADIGVGAGGVSLLERCCLGLPTIVLSIAENQRAGSTAAANSGACQYLGFASEATSTEISGAIQNLLNDSVLFQNMSIAASRISDGLGAARIAAAHTYNSMHDDVDPVMLRRVVLEDSQLLYGWQKDPETRRFARDPRAPSVTEHIAWLNDRLGRGTCILNIILSGDKPAGVLRLDNISGNREGFEVSIFVDPKKKRRGIARAALDQAKFLVGDDPIWAWISEKNSASHALFYGAGFEPEQDGWYVSNLSRG